MKIIENIDENHNFCLYWFPNINDDHIEAFVSGYNGVFPRNQVEVNVWRAFHLRTCCHFGHTLIGCHLTIFNKMSNTVVL